MYMTSFGCMASTMRRPRGTASQTQGIYVEVQPEKRAAFDRLVRATGASQWALVEAMIQHTADLVDAGEAPDWLPTTDQGVLFDNTA